LFSPISDPGILTVGHLLVLAGVERVVYAFTFISAPTTGPFDRVYTGTSSAAIFPSGSRFMVASLIPTIPLALLYNAS